MSRKLISDFLYIAGLLLGSIITLYFAPQVISKIYFMALLVLFFFSKKNYLWLVFVFVLVDPPGGLFPSSDLNYGLVIITSPFFINFQELFIYTCLLKIFRYSRKLNLVYQKPLVLLLAYFFMLYGFSFLMGSSPLQLLKTIKFMLPWTLLITVPILMKQREEWFSFFRLLYPFVFVAILMQIGHILLGYPVANLLGSDFQTSTGEISPFFSEIDPLEYTEQVLRPISSPHIVLISFVSAMVFLGSRIKLFKNAYLLIISLTGTLSVYLTATRGWIIAFLIMWGLYMILYLPKLKVFIQAVMVAGVLLLLLNVSNIVNLQVSGAAQRLSTLEGIAEGDLSAGGTVMRYTEYTPFLLKKFAESPIFGWAFSNEFFAYNNPHAGLANILMNTGIIGGLLFLFLWYYMVKMPVKVNRVIGRNNPYKNGITALVIGLIGLVVIHATSGQVFAYMIGFIGSGFGLLFFFLISDFFMKDALDVDTLYRPSAPA